MSNIPSYKPLKLPRTFGINCNFKPLYYQCKNTKNEYIIFSNSKGIYQYDIKNEAFSKLSDIHKKAQKYELIHTLIDSTKGILYRLQYYNIFLFSIPKKQWIACIPVDLCCHTSEAIYIPPSLCNNHEKYIYLMDLKYNSECTAYKFTLKTKKFIPQKHPKQIYIAKEEEYIHVDKQFNKWNHSNLCYNQCLERLLLIQHIIEEKEYLKEVKTSTIYMLDTSENKWIKILDINFKSNFNNKYYNESYHLICSFSHCLIIFIMYHRAIFFVDLITKQVWIGDIQSFMDYHKTKIEYIVKTEGNDVEGNGVSIHLLGDQHHSKMNIFDLIPSEWVDPLICGYIKSEERKNDFCLPDVLHQTIIRYFSPTFKYTAF